MLLETVGALAVAWGFLIAGTVVGDKIFKGGLETILPSIGVGVASAAAWLAVWWWLL